MKYALLNGLLGAALLAYGMAGENWWLVWLGMCFVILGIAYAKRKATVFGKRPDGTLPIWSWLVFLPLHVYTLLVWHLIRLISREPACGKVHGAVTIGRRLLAHELPGSTHMVVDLTAEFQEPAAITSHRDYRSFPILDATAPDEDALRHFIRNLPAGPVYIHCAQGHGRTALFTAAFLMERGLCTSLEEARSLIKTARPGARMNREQEAFIQRTYGSLQRPTKPADSFQPPIPQNPAIDFQRLWAHVIAACPPHDSFSVHGPDHWRRVERNALILASRTGAKVEVVRLFAIFHDCRRLSDGWEPSHGRSGAEYAATLRGIFFQLSDEDFALLQEACIWHTEGKHHPDPTIGTCWDADRLDLGRVGLIPHADYMSTRFGQEIANHGVIHPWLHLAEPYLAGP
ncbi:MAG TPA: hypothetical protein DCP71_10770 [Verrucomicrobiales bacterium]|nr:hypothetical protein [Verrucomicrobiales bacterium]